MYKRQILYAANAVVSVISVFRPILSISHEMSLLNYFTLADYDVDRDIKWFISLNNEANQTLLRCFLFGVPSCRTNCMFGDTAQLITFASLN